MENIVILPFLRHDKKYFIKKCYFILTKITLKCKIVFVS
nr:MAG TPA: hypothetical protein [Caudoviricetes sp.]